MRAADLLLALDKPAQTQGYRSTRLLVGPNSLDSPKEVAFVVGHATRIELAVTHHACVRWAVPELERFRRLHVVVVIQEESVPPLSQLTQDDGRTVVYRHDLYVCTDIHQLTAHHL